MRQSTQRKVIYVPPSTQAIDSFVRETCQSLGRTNPAFNQWQVRHGLSNFLKIVAQIYVRQLNDAQNDPSPDA